MRPNRLTPVALVFVGLALILWALTTWLAPYERRMDGLLADINKEFPQLPRVSAQELSKWLADTSRRKPMLFDVRSKEEFDVSHLPGAIRIDPRERVGPLLEKLPAQIPSVFYCTVGYRSSLTADQLRAMGRTNVYGLEGAIFAWANAGLPLQSNGVPTSVVHPYSQSYTRLLKPEARYPLSGYKSFAYEYGYLVNPTKALSATLLLAVFLAWESIAPFFGWFRRKPRERAEHGLRNLTLGLINTFAVAFIFVRLWNGVTHWASAEGFGLLNALNFEGWRRTLLTLLLLDAWMWTWHWLNHHIGFLWRFHRTHHTELRMDVTSATRFHIGEIAFSGLLRIPLLALFGIAMRDIVIYETLLFAIVQFHHANIRLPWMIERWLRWVIVTPNFHRVHHSRQMVEANSNYSSLLSMWDTLLSTRNWRDRPEEIVYGVDQFDKPEQHTITGMLASPLADHGTEASKNPAV